MVPIAELRQAAKAVGFRIGDAWNFGHEHSIRVYTTHPPGILESLADTFIVNGHGKNTCAATARARKNALIMLTAIRECKLTDEEG